MNGALHDTLDIFPCEHVWKDVTCADGQKVPADGQKVKADPNPLHQNDLQNINVGPCGLLLPRRLGAQTLKRKAVSTSHCWCHIADNILT